MPGSAGPIIERHRIHTSFLQRAQKKYRRFLPLFPLAIESFDLKAFDLVVSTSHAVAKGCVPRPDAVHVSYVHTPMRYVWDQFDAYFGKGRADPFTRLAAWAVTPWLRRWDVRSTGRAQGLVANSRFVAGRIEKYWHRQADAVVYPPVDTARFVPSAEGPAPEGYALIVSALVPYKRVDLAVRAFSKLSRPLWVGGDGPELERLRRLAGPSVTFLGSIPDEALPGLYARAKFFVLPGEEDFGIAPVEAQSAGRPVLALGRGGALETVVDGQTGVFFGQSTEESLIDGIERIERLDADPSFIREHATRFGADRFGPELKAVIDAVIDKQ